MARQRVKPKSTSGGLRRYSRLPLTRYYRSEAEETNQTSPFTRRPLKKSRRKLVFGLVDILLIAMLLIGLVYSLLLTASPSITVDSLDYHYTGSYKAVAAQDFSGLKDRNKISFDETAVTAKLQSQFPEIESVSVELPFFSQQAKVRMIVSKPAFLLSSDSKVFVIDNQGRAVDQVNNLPKVNGLVTINDQTGFITHAGQQVLAAGQVQFINQVIAQARHANVPIASLTLPALAQEMDLRTTDQSYYVKFYLGGEPLPQIGQFLAARQNFAAKGGAPSEYLDVRVAGKIFYK